MGQPARSFGLGGQNRGAWDMVETWVTTWDELGINLNLRMADKQMDI